MEYPDRREEVVDEALDHLHRARIGDTLAVNPIRASAQSDEGGNVTAGTIIFLGMVFAALAAMDLLTRGLPSRYQGWCSTYGTSNNFNGKDAVKLAHRAYKLAVKQDLLD